MLAGWESLSYSGTDVKTGLGGGLRVKERGQVDSCAVVSGEGMREDPFTVDPGGKCCRTW